MNVLKIDWCASWIRIFIVLYLLIDKSIKELMWKELVFKILLDNEIFKIWCYKTVIYRWKKEVTIVTNSVTL